MGDSEFKVFAISNPSETNSPNNNTSPSSSTLNQLICDAKGVESLRDVSGEVLLVCCIDLINKLDIPTLLDSDVSDYCFADILLFTSYTPFERPSPELTAKEGLIFNVIGKGNVKIQINVNGDRRTITFDNALYTPGFRSNLISMARLSVKGAEVYFKDNKTMIRTKNGIDIISATRSELLYAVEIDKIQPTVFMTQSK